MGVRENAKGTVIAQIMDLLAHIFANAMQLAAATIRTITGMIKMRTHRRSQVVSQLVVFNKRLG